MKRFEGPAKGIIFSPNEVSRTSISSKTVAVSKLPLSD
jgi:hypothetical protein